MDVHASKWTCAGTGFKAKMPSLNWSEQEAFDGDSRQQDKDAVFKK